MKCDFCNADLPEFIPSHVCDRDALRLEIHSLRVDLDGISMSAAFMRKAIAEALPFLEHAESQFHDFPEDLMKRLRFFVNEES